MLQIIRSHMLGWFAKILVGFICLAFAIFGIQSYLVDRGGDDSVAKVNGEKIHNSQLSTAYNRLRLNTVSQFGQNYRITTELQEKLRQQALQQLINQAILYQHAEKLGFKVSPQVVNAAIQSMPGFQKDGQFSPELFSRVLYNMNYTPASFFRDMTQALTISQLMDGIHNTTFALPSEIESAYLLAEQKRDFRFLVLSVAQAENNIQVPQQEIAAYYQKHTQDFQSTETVDVEYVELSADAILANQTATDQEVQDYYNNNSEYFSSPARWQVAKMVVPVKEDADAKTVKAAEDQIKLIAEQMAKETKAPADAKVYWVSPDKEQMGFVKVLASKKIGDVTEVGRDKDGFVVYKLLAHEQPKVKPFDEVKATVKEALLKHKAEQEFGAKNDQLAELAFTSPDSLKPISTALKLPIQEAFALTAQGSKEGLGANPKIVSAAFSDAVLQQSTNSEPVELKNGHIVVLRIKQHHPAKTLPLSEVQEKIISILKKQQALAAIKKQGETLLAELSAGKNPQDLAKTAQVSWQERISASRQEKGLDHKIIHLAFSHPAAKNNHAEFLGGTLANGDYAIVTVEKIHQADKKKLTEQERSVYANQLANNYANEEIDFYLKALKAKAKIVIAEKE